MFFAFRGGSRLSSLPYKFCKTTVAAAVLLTLLSSPVCFGETIRLVAIGDSLIAGYGLPAEDGFVSQLENALIEKSYDVRLVNAGVSGDTTNGALARIDWVLAEPYSAVILHVGYNDAFRGIPTGQVHQNLERLLAKIDQRGLPTLLAGAMAPRNLGADYYLAFDAIFPQLSNQYDLVHYPFFLEGVATEPTLNQADGIHPNKDGVSLIVRQMLPYVEQLIERLME